VTKTARKLALAISTCVMCAISSPVFAAVVTAVNDSFSTIENQPVSGNVLSNDLIASGYSVLNVWVPNFPADGTLSFNDITGDFTYTPACSALKTGSM
jgi:large repetitive protein